MKKSTKLPVIVNFILDRSGSMSSVQDATISGFNEYVQTLAKDRKAKYEFTLTLFDTVVDRKETVSIGKVEKLSQDSYHPEGMTALYDAVCKTINEVKEKKGQKVLNVIMTDGEENSSREYTQVQMKKIIEDKEKKGNWMFVYLGANQDSYKVAQNYGIKVNNVTNFNATARGVGQTFSTSAVNTVMYAASSDPKDFFSKKDQDDLGKAK